MMGEMRDKKDRSILLIGSLDSESIIMKEKSLIYIYVQVSLLLSKRVMYIAFTFRGGFSQGDALFIRKGVDWNVYFRKLVFLLPFLFYF